MCTLLIKLSKGVNSIDTLYKFTMYNNFGLLTLKSEQNYNVCFCF